MTAACPKFWVAVSLLVAITPAARAGPLSWLDAISGAAEREGANALRTAAKLGRDLGKEEKRAILESGDRGTFRLTNPDDGNLIATFEPDTVSSLGLTGYVVVIPEQLLNTQPEVVRRLLKEPGLKSAVAADDRLWPLRLESIPGQEALLVEASENLGLTTKAFEHRAVLERISSGPLVRRMRVVPMISRADPVAAAAFREGVPQASTLPADRTDALGLIGRNREKLLVITGHVEGEAFVVRSLSGEEEFRVPINEIPAYHRASANLRRR